MLTAGALAALRALRDLRVVGARWDHPGYRQLRERRLVSCTAATEDFDYRLTPRGEAFIEDTLP